MRRALLLINCFVLSIGHCSGPLIMRLYFIHGGKRVWFSSWLETDGWPIILLPINCGYFHRSRTQPTLENKLFFIKPRLFITTDVIKTLTGLDDYIYAYGVARLPVSKVALIIASQLVFTTVFAFVLVKQKFTYEARGWQRNPFQVPDTFLVRGRLGYVPRGRATVVGYD
ncbi:Purine permease 3 [Hibiscus syriacus]|uniref:Purine permease 3 n=1 Tax=Hibiscus syriacus TaxID=106335 RepID=A0A6A2ZGC1_HIBSY|nr:Purine permease 3 [Hibiscus syriacus]